MCMCVCLCGYGIIGKDTGKDQMCWVPGSGVRVVSCWRWVLGTELRPRFSTKAIQALNCLSLSYPLEV